MYVCMYESMNVCTYVYIRSVFTCMDMYALGAAAQDGDWLCAEAADVPAAWRL